MILKNTENTYIIEIRNTQTADGATDVIEERARGSYYEKGRKQYIMYTSSSDGGEYSSSIIVSGGGVLIRRSGALTSSITLDVMRETEAVYITPYGRIPMKARAEKIISGLGETGGTLRLYYTLVIQGEEYYNDMTINVIGDKR